MATDTDAVRRIIELLSSSDPVDWERAQELKLTLIPDQLYRYRSPNERAFQMLERGAAWLTAVDECNDPFDSAVRVDGAPLFEAQIRKGIADGSVSLPMEFTPAPIGQEALDAMDAAFTAAVEKEVGVEAATKTKGFLRKFLEHQAQEMSAKLTRAMQRGLKICCFSEAGDVPLMWAHYADSHKGFCIEYTLRDLSVDDLLLRLLMPVYYSAEPFSIVGMVLRAAGKPNPFCGVVAAMHKSADWAYEREWRLVHPSGDDSKGLEIVLPKPSRVLVGHRVSDEHRARLVEITRELSIPLVTVEPEKDSAFKLSVRG